MLAGEAPFGVAGAAPSQLDLSLIDAAPPMLAGVPDGLAEIVDACLAIDPTKRPESAAALAALLAVYGEHPVLVKREPLPAIDTGPYDTGELERLVGQTGASAAASSSKGANGWHGARATPTLQETPTPVVLTPSTPPVAMSVSVAPPPRSVPADPPTTASIDARRWLKTALIAAACIGVVVFGAEMAVRTSVEEPVAATAAAAPRAEDSPVFAAAPVATAPAITVAVSAVTSTAVAPIAVAPFAVTPIAVAPTVGPANAPKPVVVAPTQAAAALVRAASAPLRPAPASSAPKAGGDDLRRFLDDRR
jgi:hypothetical protein